MPGGCAPRSLGSTSTTKTNAFRPVGRKALETGNFRSELELQRELQTAVFPDRGGDAAGGGRADGRIRESEVRGVEQVVSLKAELGVEAFRGAEPVVFDERRIEVDVAR
jgi:hypothetical protein